MVCSRCRPLTAQSPPALCCGETKGTAGSQRACYCSGCSLVPSPDSALSRNRFGLPSMAAPLLDAV